MNDTLELIAEQLWNRGWKATWSYGGSGQFTATLFWRHVENPHNTVFASGNSALVALERARAELEKTK